VSWFQIEPTLSLQLVRLLGVEPNTAVIDVGGGASTLVAHLLAADVTELSVLDISATALGARLERVGQSPSNERRRPIQVAPSI
jgi:ubiquinone/menaquinone biosynthesis C-methylase UbiE